MKTKLALIATLGVVSALPAFANAGNPDQWFDKVDTDKNGSISMAEHEAAKKEHWMKADTNKDGMISKDEFMAQKAKMKPADNKAEPENGVGHWFTKLDTNNDGNISQAENDAAMKDKWTKADLDGDGNITKTEFETSMQRAKSEMTDHKADKPHLDK